MPTNICYNKMFKLNITKYTTSTEIHYSSIAISNNNTAKTRSNKPEVLISKWDED